MIFYFVPFLFLAILTWLESTQRFVSLIKNKYLYFLIALFFIIFIGLRYEIGCDWEQYEKMFEKYTPNMIEIIRRGLFEKNIYGIYQELGHIFITKISQNIYFLNLIYSILFSLPLFYFCSTLKRRYFSLLISYPYYIIVIGMGPIRQAACISFLMLSILFISKKKYFISFFLTIISLLIHQFSILFNGLIFASSFRNIKIIKLSRKTIFLIILVSLIFLYCLPSILNKIYVYFTLYKKFDQNGIMLVPPAKSAILLWIMNFVPSFIYLKNKVSFNLNKNLNSIFTTFCITEILLLPIVLLQSVVGYRLLLYIFPTSIYITSLIPDLKLLNIRKNYMVNIIISLAFISLIIWLKFAYHSSCWVPYKNILFNL